MLHVLRVFSAPDCSGSEIHVQPRDDGSIDFSGRVELVDHHAHGG